MNEDPNQSQIHQRNVPPPAVPPVANTNDQNPSQAPSDMQNNNQITQMVWPNASALPPPYPPLAPLVVGQESSILNRNQRNSWAIGLCDCFSDLKISFLVLLCPCVAFGKIAEIVNEGETSKPFERINSSPVIPSL
nr:protein plant cadmium resistance 2-like [Tanacetum cinerariifolium]